MNRKRHPSLSFAICFTLVLFALIASAWASDSDYKEAVKALEARDYPTALNYLESAVGNEPDNLRYASQYRQAAIQSKEFDRSVQFFEKLAATHPGSATVHLNFGFAYVDKIPSAGSITQVILANNALKEFTRAVELKPSWIAYYTRGMSYLFWPKIFNRAALGVTDLQKALEIQKAEPRRPYHVKVYIGLGDGYWKTDDLEKARAVWQEGLEKFPDSQELKNRLAQQGDQLKATIEAGFDPNKRVDTDLRVLWENAQS
jgi:tetratricopeptide (TPR) repeat protein